jgi:hypothetical protein
MISGGLQFALPGSQLTESTDATDDKILLWDESVDTWKYMTLDDLQDSIDTVGSAGISFNGSTANGVVTYGNSSTANVESTMTYDSVLSINAVSYGSAVGTTKLLSFGEGSASNEVKYLLASSIIYSLSVSVAVISTAADTVRTTVTVNGTSANSTVDLTSLSAHGS